MAELESDILKFTSEGHIIIMGDFNSRIGEIESCVKIMVRELYTTAKPRQ